MPMKIITNEEFENLSSRLSLSSKISEACKNMFVDGKPLTLAAKLSGVSTEREMEKLYAAIEVINKYLGK